MCSGIKNNSKDGGQKKTTLEKTFTDSQEFCYIWANKDHLLIIYLILDTMLATGRWSRGVAWKGVEGRNKGRVGEATHNPYGQDKHRMMNQSRKTHHSVNCRSWKVLPFQYRWGLAPSGKPLRGGLCQLDVIRSGLCIGRRKRLGWKEGLAQAVIWAMLA